MNFFVTAVILFFSLASYAQKKAEVKTSLSSSSVQAYVLSKELRYERDNSQEIVDRNPVNFSVGVEVNQVSLLLEYSSFEENTGNETANISRKYQDVSLWFRHHFYREKFAEAKWSVFAGGGAGGFEEEVRTTLMGESRTDKAAIKMFAGLVFGAVAAVEMKKNIEFLVGAEGRTLLASEYDPNPIWSAVLRLGLGVRF